MYFTFEEDNDSRYSDECAEDSNETYNSFSHDSCPNDIAAGVWALERSDNLFIRSCLKKKSKLGNIISHKFFPNRSKIDKYESENRSSHLNDSVSAPSKSFRQNWDIHGNQTYKNTRRESSQILIKSNKNDSKLSVSKKRFIPKDDSKNLKSNYSENQRKRKRFNGNEEEKRVSSANGLKSDYLEVEGSVNSSGNNRCSSSNLDNPSPKTKFLKSFRRGSGKKECLKDKVPSTSAAHLSISDDFVDRPACLSDEKYQVLLPCPTCGRKFNEQAAFRHFPICFKAKEKKTVNSRNNSAPIRVPKTPTYSTPMIDPYSQGDRREGRNFKKNLSDKPITFSFHKAGKLIKEKLTESKPVTASTDHSKAHNKSAMKTSNEATPSSCGNYCTNEETVKHQMRTKYFKQRLPFGKSEGIKKSAMIWRKSFKDSVKLDARAKVVVRQNKRSESSDSENTFSCSSQMDLLNHWNSGKSNRGATNTAKTMNLSKDCSAFPISKRTSMSSVQSTVVIKHSTYSESTSQNIETNLLGSNTAPASVRYSKECRPNNVRKCHTAASSCLLDDPKEKFEPCYICGYVFRSADLEGHLGLCARIKKIEETFMKANVGVNFVSPSSDYETPTKPDDSSGKEQLQYKLLKHDDSASETAASITTIECPCCAQLLDLCRIAD